METTIGVVGKYVDLTDSYKSLNEALFHGGIANYARVNLKFIDSETLTPQSYESLLADVDAVLVPGGFGERGIEGKILAIGWARRNEVPYFGICLGMQLMAVEFARNVADLGGANSVEFAADSPHPIIHYMVDQSASVDKGATMRLGAYPCVLADGSRAAQIYGASEISERHRHRLEFNNAYRSALEEHGLVISGQSPDGTLVEMIELPEHPWYIGCQFHPEFKSRPTAAHPLFESFVAAAIARKG